MFHRSDFISLIRYKTYILFIVVNLELFQIVLEQSKLVFHEDYLSFVCNFKRAEPLKFVGKCKQVILQ